MKNLSRRRFFEDSVMAAAAAALPVPLLAQDRKSVSPNEKLTVAIIGCGIRGKAHAKELARLADCDIAYVCDPDLDRADEVAGLLRAGQMVGLPMRRDVVNREHVGRLEVGRIRAALETGVPVVPVATVGREIGREWQLVVGEPVRLRRKAGPLAAQELAEATRSVVQELLDESLPATWWW